MAFKKGDLAVALVSLTGLTSGRSYQVVQVGVGLVGPMLWVADDNGLLAGFSAECFGGVSMPVLQSPMSFKVGMVQTVSVECVHSFVLYTGLNECFEHCKFCGLKGGI